MTHGEDVKPLSSHLEKEPLWQAAMKIIEQFNSMANLTSDEMYWLDSRIKYGVTDFSSDIAEALGSTTYDDTVYFLSSSRRQLFRLKANLISAKKLGEVEIEPEFIVEINRLIDMIDLEIEEGRKRLADIRHKEEQNES